jgi:hypothetical protein
MAGDRDTQHGKNSQVSMGNYLFKADDYDGKGSIAISYYNTSSPSVVNRTIVTEGEYAEDGDLRFYGKRITNVNNIVNGRDVFGLWPCCPRATINVWQKIWIVPTETVAGASPPNITFSISGSGTNTNTLLVGQQIRYAISIRAGDSNIKNLTIVLDPAGLLLLKGETAIRHAEIYSGESQSHDGVFIASIVGQLNPGIEWSYMDANNNIVEGAANVPITIQPPITVTKYYPDMVCTGSNASFSFGIVNLQTVSVNVSLTDVLPDGFSSGGFGSFKKDYQLELAPGEAKTVAYIAEPKVVGLIQVPAAEVSWRLGNFVGTLDTNGGMIKVYGPLIAVSKTAAVKNNENENSKRNETIGVTVNILNLGDTNAYVEVVDAVPLNLSDGNISGSAVYKGNIEAGGTKNISYEFRLSHNQEDGNEVNLSDIMDNAPQIKVYASKYDSKYPDTEHPYSSAYIFKKRLNTNLIRKTDAAEISRNTDRNPSIMFNDIYTKQPDTADSRSAPESKSQSHPSPSILERIRLFLKGITGRV